MSTAAAVAGVEPDLIVRREGSAGIIRLNRPKAINAMTLEMSLGIEDHFGIVMDEGGDLAPHFSSLGTLVGYITSRLGPT